MVTSSPSAPQDLQTGVSSSSHEGRKPGSQGAPQWARSGTSRSARSRRPPERDDPALRRCIEVLVQPSRVGFEHAMWELKEFYRRLGTEPAF
jgi:hypothetical protein